MEKLKDKIAIVTGGGSGIGKSVSEILSAHGASLYILEIDVQNGRDTENDIVKAGNKATFIQCDISSQSATRKVIDKIYADEERIDILINNAGISHIGTAEDTSESDFDRIFAVNVKGVYNCLHICIPYMKKSGGGVIINMSSVAALVGLPDRFAYTMSKGAVHAITYSVAKDYLADNIRCNGIAPGRVHTPFVDGFLKKNFPGKEKKMYDKLAKTQPIGRMGKPDEIAGLVLYLCSDEASFITGSIYPIDGGFVTLNT